MPSLSRKIYISAGILLFSFIGWAQNAPSPIYPIPNNNQMRWQQMEYYAFVHFSLNTYTDQAWGYGNESVQLFNPKDLDCRQWARICKEAGMKGIIVTAKHHCGFCLWPSKYTEYSVKNAPWKDGKGDVIKELAQACKEYGLKLGVYLSPWDRNHPDYGKPEYITYFRNQLTELLTNYGEIFEIWFDGANGGDGYYGGANQTRIIDRTTYYDWKNTYALIRKLQPNIVIWNDGGDRADLRWVGTEDGYVGETNWSLLNGTGDVSWSMLHYGLENGDSWVPAEVNTSIRPEWFYHPSEDGKVKKLPALMNTYYNSIGHNASLLLNFPIMPNGLINNEDEKASIDFHKTVEQSFKYNLTRKAKASASNTRGNNKTYAAANSIDNNPDTYWTTDDQINTVSLIINFHKPEIFNRILLQEYIQLGQRVKAFDIEAYINNEWKQISKATTIGYKRILRFPTVETTKIRINITDSKSSPVISNIGVFNAPVILDAPTILRNQEGDVSISSNDIGTYFYYTTDGSEPTISSQVFNSPFKADGKITIKAISYDPGSRKSSAVAVEKFVGSKKNWEIQKTTDFNSKKILDGDPATVWHQRGINMPLEVIVDLGNQYKLKGFRYLPDQNRWSSGIITKYEFYISTNNSDWILVSEGEFSNIKNNPQWQEKIFDGTTARYIKLKALKNTQNDSVAGYAELDIITE